MAKTLTRLCPPRPQSLQPRPLSPTATTTASSIPSPAIPFPTSITSTITLSVGSMSPPITRRRDVWSPRRAVSPSGRSAKVVGARCKVPKITLVIYRFQSLEARQTSIYEDPSSLLYRRNQAVYRLMHRTPNRLPYL